eukprot:c21598_g1_i1.p1 GENE.c21598_g1_i1~~c21598_g1_i1.p1  ORF type:complete len:226 (+),score=15.61 c21598_g1_i1:124-801(+)
MHRRLSEPGLALPDATITEPLNWSGLTRPRTIVDCTPSDSPDPDLDPISVDIDAWETAEINTLETEEAVTAESPHEHGISEGTMAFSSDDEVSTTKSEAEKTDNFMDLLDLRQWCADHSLSRTAMNALLKVLCKRGHPQLPADWRTVLSWCERHDKESIEAATNDISTEQRADALVFVCGACTLHRFLEEDISSALPCDVCNVSQVQCGNQNCSKWCIVSEAMGN